MEKGDVRVPETASRSPSPIFLGSYTRLVTAREILDVSHCSGLEKRRARVKEVVGGVFGFGGKEKGRMEGRK